MDELMDIVNDNDEVIGSEYRNKLYLQNVTNFRVINCFIINSKRELFIPRRSAGKRIFPLCLDMSVGGHVKSGESYIQAFKREIQEELNINIEKTKYKELGKLVPSKNNVSAFMMVYEIKMNKIPNYNRSDFIEHYWLNPKEFFKRLEEGDKCKEDLPKLIKHFYFNEL